MHTFLLRLSHRLVFLAMDAALRRSLPLIFRRLDAEIPLLLSHKAPPVRVEGTIASAIADALGKRATSEQVQAVVALYDPISAAAKAFGR